MCMDFCPNGPATGRVPAVPRDDQPVSDDGAYESHLETSVDTRSGPALHHGPPAEPDAPPLRAPAVAALGALVALARADGVRVELEVPATRGEDDHPGWPLCSAQVRFEGGGGVGVFAWSSDGHEQETAAEEAARVTDSVHEGVVEWMPGEGRSTSWPSCPQHPETHPLELVPGSDGDPRPRWRCPRTREVVGPLG